MAKKYKIVFGVDEVGRGTLAGSVVACAMTKLKMKNEKLKTTKKNLKIRDSKQLNPRQREIIFNNLKNDDRFVWALGRVGERTIDKINIFEATKLAMERAVENLIKKLEEQEGANLLPNAGGRRFAPSFAPLLLIDGNFGINLPYPQKSIIKGDEKVPLIALASIAAKVSRDRMMIRAHQKYPQYGFAKHKGYGTKYHISMLQEFGPCQIHRISFAPCKNYKFLV